MPDEPTVSQRSLPRGYSLARKGNVYITANCRKLTHTAGQTVYAVLDPKQKPIGIAVPTAILDTVRQNERDTRADRATNVQKRDASIEKGFAKVILDEFPRIPPASLPLVLRTALKKGKGKVGRTGTLTDRQKARLAVRAHIRHAETEYEQLLGAGKPKREARDAVGPKIDAVARSWGGSTGPRVSKKRAKTGKARPGAAKLSSKTSKSHHHRPRPAKSGPSGSTVEGDGARLRAGTSHSPGKTRRNDSRRVSSSPLSSSPIENPLVSLRVATSRGKEKPSRHAQRGSSSVPVIDLTGDDDDDFEDDGDDVEDESSEEDDDDDDDDDSLEIISSRQASSPPNSVEFHGRITRSRQRINDSIQALSQRLPDSPEPETHPRLVIGQPPRRTS